MPKKHALVFVHGMGDHAEDWHEPAMAILTAAFGDYEAFKGRASFIDLVDPVPVVYSDLFTQLRAQWQEDAAGLKTMLGAQLESADQSERKRIEAQIDSVADKAGAGTDTFMWTHAMDVVLYRFFKLVRHAVNVSLAKQLLQVATDKRYDGWSVVAHCLGTAVTHNTLHAMYTTPLVPGQPLLRTVETRPRLLAMVANVSRVLQLPGLKAYTSKVAPGSALLNRACQTYLNIRHQWDPFTIPDPFKPDPGWPDVSTFNSVQYQHIDPSHLQLDQYRNVHDLEHYLRNPRVHIPIFRALFGDGIIAADEFNRACEKFDTGVLNENTNIMRDQLDKLLPAGSGSWAALLGVLFQLYGKGNAP